MNDLQSPGSGSCFGMCFRATSVPGGAPANFACHCHRLGAVAYPVSCVGRDEPGVKIREELRVMGVDTSYLLESERHPTGTVHVSLDDKGKPSCQILEDVARDYIPLTDGLKALAENLDAVCFGSLSQRSAVSRETIHVRATHAEGSLEDFRRKPAAAIIFARADRSVATARLGIEAQ